MENLICNFTGSIREEILLGRKHLVAPATLIVPGVLNGSLGPLYYPPEEVSANPSKWNNVPITVYHPGGGASARTPAVLNRQGIGTVLNASITDSGNLQAELWFDVERTQQVDARVYDSLANSQQMELSTGLSTQNEKAEEGSVFNNPTLGDIPYTHIARNYKPDHLAILPDQVGACSLSDGCGLLNKLSEDDVRETLRSVLREKFREELWIETLYANEVIYSLAMGGLFRLKYTRSKDKVTLSSDEPVAVQRVTTFKVVNEKESSMPAKKLSEKARKQVIDSLIENSCCWVEEDRAELDAMTDNQLSRTKEVDDKQVETENLLAAAQTGFNSDTVSIAFNQEKKTWEHTEIKPKEEPVSNQGEAKPLTDQEWLDKAPIGIQNTIRHAQESEQQERKALVEQIIINVDDNAKPEKVTFLANKSIEELHQIASLMPKQAQTRVGDFYGAQPTNQMQPVENIDRDDMLENEKSEIDWEEFAQTE